MNKKSNLQGVLLFLLKFTQNKATNLLARVLGQWAGVKISVSFFFHKNMVSTLSL